MNEKVNYHLINEVLFYSFIVSMLENAERLLSYLGIRCRFMSHNVEANSFRQRTTLTHRYNISFLYIECRRAVGCNICVSLLKSTVLSDVMKIVPSNDDCTLHLGRYYKTLQNAATNRHVSSERTLLVDVVTLSSCIRGLDSKSNRFDKSHRFLLVGTNHTFTCDENGILALVGLLMF
jgi:hypothetical protein